MSANPVLDSQPVSLPAAGDLTASLFHFGKIVAGQIAACTVQGERADGIIGTFFTHVPVAGDAVDFYVNRMPLIEAGAAYASGVDLTTDITGRAVLAGVGDTVNARSVDAATAAGQYVRVLPPYAKPTVTTVANAGLSPANAQVGALVVIPIDTGVDHATQTLAYVTPVKIEIIDVVCTKTGAGAGNTITVQNGAAAAISDAIAFNTDKAVTRAGTLDPATRVIAAGGTINVLNTKAAGVSTGQVFLHGIVRP